MPKKKEGYVSRYIEFDESEPYEKDAIHLLNLSKKSAAKLIGIMTHEFMEKYKISPDDPREKLQFIIDGYANLMDLKNRGVFSDTVTASQVDTYKPQNNQSTEPVAAVQTPESQEDNSDFTEDKLKQALAGFGF